MLRRVQLSLLTSVLTLTIIAFAQNSKVVLINVFKVPAAQEAEITQTWIKSKEFLEKQPGYINTRAPIR
jgi:hypothetical protein